MADPSIAEIRVDGPDMSGNRVICIYAQKPPEYLVYRSAVRVMVQFADDPAKASQQRASIAPLNPLRGQISGLIDGWHQSEDEKVKARAARYDRRVADAIVTGLEENIPDALALLAEIRDDIIAERKSLAQNDYLLVAATCGVLFIGFVAMISWLVPNQFPHAELIWTGAAGGTLGAFFSVATGLRASTILIDLLQWDNRRDAILRLAVGTIAGGILLLLILTNMATIAQIGRKSLLSNPDRIEPLLMALVLGFLAGFSERAVPGLLSRATLSTEDDADDVALKQAKAAGAPITPNSSGKSGSARAASHSPENSTSGATPTPRDPSARKEATNSPADPGGDLRPETKEAPGGEAKKSP